MTKGVLVVAMVIYHSFNYSTDYTLGFKYLPFLPPSFILITGFLISRLYFKPEVARDLTAHGRLLLRGFRLLLLFTLLNVATQAAGRHKFGTDPQGIAWETYRTLGEAEIYGAETKKAKEGSTCCTQGPETISITSSRLSLRN